MDDRALDLAKALVTPTYISSGAEALAANEKHVRSMLAQRRAPEKGMSDVAIEQLINTLSMMDSNNFVGHAGAGEREGRVFSSLVARRHYGMSHGIGRSGELTADQPKAAGSSLMAQLTHSLALDFLRAAGAPSTERAIVCPMATGMSLSLVLSTLRNKRPDAKVVIWPRIDQKTCLKCIYAAGFTAVVVPLQPAKDPKPPKSKRKAAGKGASSATGEGASPSHRDPSVSAEESISSTPSTEPAVADHSEAALPKNCFLQCPAADIEAAIASVGPENVAAVLSTTSCFSPRLPDDVLGIARVCAAANVPHVVNNAYGVQSREIMKKLEAAMTHGRVDAFVQSGDKNFLVPVGGAVIAGKKDFINDVSQLYAGRASSAPVMDLFITFLSMGRVGFTNLLDKRYEVLARFHHELTRFAAQVGESIMIDPRNDISFYMTLRNVPKPAEIGAHLFRHCISGPRVVEPSPKAKAMCGHQFISYGSHFDATSVPMLVMACGIGMEQEEIDIFVERLEAIYTELVKHGGGGEKK